MSDGPGPMTPRAGYHALFRNFDAPAMERVREEAYGEDVGQHSWVSAAELRADAGRLGLRPGVCLLDLGCGPAGPLTFLVEATGCNGTGLDVDPAAVAAARRRMRSLGVAQRCTVRRHDLDDALPFATASVDACMSIDVVLHLRDREALCREVRRILKPGGRMLFTDAGVLTGALSDEERRVRGHNGRATFAPDGTNEAALRKAGLRLLEREDRTAAAARTAIARRSAMHRHRDALATLIGAGEVEQQLAYLDIAHQLAERRALSRFMYLAERSPEGA